MSPATPPGTPAARLISWLESLPAERRDALARRYAEATTAGGATILKPDGRVLSIPPLLTPEILDATQLAAVERNAHAITAGLARLTAWLMGKDGAALRSRLFRAFVAFESEALTATWREAERLATVRVDYLMATDETPRALEVNATIPAMQGYSDIVASAFLREVAREHGAPAALAGSLLDANGRNSDQLLASLLAHHALATGRDDRPPRRIAIIARRGDAQLGELQHLAARWSELGHSTTLAAPDDVTLDAGDLRVQGVVPDLVYRHVFARRLDAASPFARACLEPRRHRIFNPIASHLEVKAMLGLLSQAADPSGQAFADTLGLDEELRDEVRRSVPWTRLLAPGAAVGPAGEPMTDLASTVANEPERFVIKKSWDYGGRSVFLGTEHDERAARRAGDVLETGGSLAWDELVRAATLDERDVWVVQEFVGSSTRRHLVASDRGAAWKDLFVDLSVYTNLGVNQRPLGGVTRASERRIVNLQGGGGLAPLLRAEIIDRLLAGR